VVLVFPYYQYVATGVTAPPLGELRQFKLAHYRKTAAGDEGVSTAEFPQLKNQSGEGRSNTKI